QVSIPASIRKALGLREGDALGFELEGNAVRVVPIVTVPKDQLWFYTTQVQKKMQKAVEEIEKGKGSSFSNAEDLIRWLKK
ncbi:MAG: AbrB/MazE/SpoVT family DNA-binding domain-containing protein, partial [Deltaproteobacteria bacterium]|nr:AbrB/MazE/SpoVT family DNA-binding domain-containing protein [Deltaproteobacteria bacterium]